MVTPLAGTLHVMVKGRDWVLRLPLVDEAVLADTLPVT
jgi:hypothetical protein